MVTLGSPILGNVSAIATDTILLDTVKPIALSTQDRFTVDRGGSVSFDSTTSVDQNPQAASGVDPASATWQFKDGTPQATGTKVTHVFNQAGTFVGDLRVRDRAGNLSDIRQFAVTVNPGPGGSSVGTLRGITGTAAFNLDRLRVSARYVRSRLKGSIILSGSAAQAGALRAELRRSARGRLLGKIVAKRLKVGAFTRTLKLPESLLPGTYRLAFVGPGGTLRTTLTLKAPREGVIRSGRISGAGVLFRFAAQPVKALRGKLTVAWSQGSRSLGTVPVASGASIRAALPGGATLGGGRLRAVLRAGGDRRGLRGDRAALATSPPGLPPRRRLRSLAAANRGGARKPVRGRRGRATVSGAVPLHIHGPRAGRGGVDDDPGARRLARRGRHRSGRVIPREAS